MKDLCNTVEIVIGGAAGLWFRSHTKTNDGC